MSLCKQARAPARGGGRGRRTSFWQALAQSAAEWLSENKAISERALEKTKPRFQSWERGRASSNLTDRERACVIWAQLLAEEEMRRDYVLSAKEEGEQPQDVSDGNGKIHVPGVLDYGLHCFVLFLLLFFFFK